ncbi:MAG: hypothetical protein ACKOWF_13475 [Chloroflexota bacterium]
MDQHRFDGLARSLAAVRGRRAAAAALAGAVLSAAAHAEPAEAAIRLCRLPGNECSSGRVCCSRTCQQGVCGCVGRGGSCYQIGAACCSGRCRRGKCR